MSKYPKTKNGFMVDADKRICRQTRWESLIAITTVAAFAFVSASFAIWQSVANIA